MGTLGAGDVVGGAVPVVDSGVVAGSATLAVTGDGRLDLTGNNTHTGAVTITSGELRLSGAPRLDLDLAGPFASAVVAALDGAPVVPARAPQEGREP